MTDNTMYAIIGAAVVFLIFLFFTSYVKAPSDKVFIITGGGKKPKYLNGQAGFKVPFIQRKDVLSLQMLSVDVKTTQTIPTLDYININVDSVAVIKIGNDPAHLSKAAENFLNKDTAYINTMVGSVLEGNLREIIGSMKLQEIMNDRKTFALKVQENADADMRNMGLEIVTFNIQNIDDGALGVIENLGIANTVAIRKSAEISKANAEKEIKVAQADANQAANEAEVKSKTSIAERETALALKRAELKAQADIEMAKAEAAGNIEAQKQRKSINAEEVNAEIAKAERETELRNKQVAVKEQELAASIKKQAEAEKYAAQQKAEADKIRRQNEADAKKYEQEKQAEAEKAVADAARYVAEQTAAAIRAKGEAEAAAIEAKGVAEAEATKKKAEAMKQYGQAAMVQMIIEKLPEMAKAIAEPMANIKNLNIYDASSDKPGENGTMKVTGMVPSVMKQVFDITSDITGVDMGEIVKAKTYDAVVKKDITVDGNVDSVVTEDVATDINKIEETVE